MQTRDSSCDGRPRPRRVAGIVLDARWDTPGSELRTRVGPARQQAETKLAAGLSLENLGQHRGRVIVANDQEVTILRIHGNPGVTKVAMNDTGLVLLVIVDPKLNGGLFTGHVVHDTGHRSGSNPGLATGSEKRDRKATKVEGVASGSTTEK